MEDPAKILPLKRERDDPSHFSSSDDDDNTEESFDNIFTSLKETQEDFFKILTKMYDLFSNSEVEDIEAQVKKGSSSRGWTLQRQQCHWYSGRGDENNKDQKTRCKFFASRYPFFCDTDGDNHASLVYLNTCIKISTIPNAGFGLFARDDAANLSRPRFRTSEDMEEQILPYVYLKGDIIGPYYGIHVDSSTSEYDKNPSDYAYTMNGPDWPKKFNVKHEYCIEAGGTQMCLARNANDSKGGLLANTKILPSLEVHEGFKELGIKGVHPFLIAIKDILPGEELFFDYGKHYTHSPSSSPDHKKIKVEEKKKDEFVPLVLFDETIPVGDKVVGFTANNISSTNEF